MTEALRFIERPAMSAELLAQAACHFGRLGVSRADAAALFFPGRGDSWAVRDAKAICNGGCGVHPATGEEVEWPGCPVRDECLAWALESGEKHGIWGGASERERRDLRRRQRGAA